MNIKEIKEHINTQDNWGTADPLYCIYEYREYPRKEGYSYDRKEKLIDCWLCEDGERYSDFEEEYEAISLLAEGDIEITINGQKWTQETNVLLPVFVTACFTEQGARNYIERKKYDLNQPYIYVHSLVYNQEMKEIREHLTALEDL